MGINQNLINKVTSKQIRTDLPEINTGDTVRVHVKISEGGKERIQMYEGFILKTAGTGASKTFTVRKESYGIGVERTFPVNSPIVADIDILKVAKVRRSRIFYMRNRQGKAARIKEATK
jgi:large subunit ribosomal protein L19